MQLFEIFMVFRSAETHNEPAVPSRDGEASLLAAQRQSSMGEENVR